MISRFNALGELRRGSKFCDLTLPPLFRVSVLYVLFYSRGRDLFLEVDDVKAANFKNLFKLMLGA